jgi:hypothetical protein
MGGRLGGEVGLTALALKPVTEGVQVERFPLSSDQEGHVFRRSRLQHRPQLGMEGNRQHGARLGLGDAKQAVADVLTAHSHDICPALSCVQQEGKRKPSLGALGMPRLERRNVGLAPSVEPRGAVSWSPHTNGWIVGPQAGRNRVPHQGP